MNVSSCCYHGTKKVKLKNEVETHIEDFGQEDTIQLPPLVRWAIERGKSLPHLGAKVQVNPLNQKPLEVVVVTHKPA